MFPANLQEFLMIADHIPGPWTFKLDDVGMDFLPIETNKEKLVAYVCHSSREGVQAANARLIAAAPELLLVLVASEKALSGLIDSIEAHHATTLADTNALRLMAQYRLPVLARMRAAIANVEWSPDVLSS